MRKIVKSKKWFAFGLAFLLIAIICINSSDAFLWATGEDETATSEQAESGPAEEVVQMNVESEPVQVPEETEETRTPAEPENVVPEATEEVEEVMPEATEEAKNEMEPEAEEAASPEAEEEDEKEPEEEIAPEEEEAEEVERSVKVVSSLAGVETVEEGTSITLTAELTGFDDVEYEIQWQRSVDGANWEDVDGANGIKYTFDITEETDGYLWRVGVFISEA